MRRSFRTVDEYMKDRWPITRSFGLMIGLVVCAMVGVTIVAAVQALREARLPDSSVLAHRWLVGIAGTVWFGTLGLTLDWVFRQTTQWLVFALFGAAMGAWGGAGKLIFARRAAVAIWPTGVGIVALVALACGVVFLLAHVAGKAFGFGGPETSDDRS